MHKLFQNCLRKLCFYLCGRFFLVGLPSMILVSRQRVSGFPEQWADLQGSPGNFRGSLGNFRAPGASGLLLNATVRELQGKSPGKLRGSRLNFPGKSRDFPEAQESPTPSQRLAKSDSNQYVSVCSQGLAVRIVPQKRPSCCGRLWGSLKAHSNHILVASEE